MLNSMCNFRKLEVIPGRIRNDGLFLIIRSAESFLWNTKRYLYFPTFRNTGMVRGGIGSPPRGLQYIITVKPVYNDHLYNKIHDLWFIQ